MLCKDIRLGEDFDYGNLSTLTPGFVGADLNSLVREAAMYAVNRIFTKLEQERLVSASGPPSLSNPVAELTLDSGQKGTCICILNFKFHLYIVQGEGLMMRQSVKC